MPKILICVVVLSLTGCGFFITPRSSDQASIREENLVAHLTYLASDELEGREAGTRGEKLAAGYIASQLRQNGVKPFALARTADGRDSLSYFQEFSSTKIAIGKHSSVIFYDSASGNSYTMPYAETFSNFHEYVDNCNISAPLVFAGFGITAPEYGYDDYAGLDVRGKVVLVLDGEPTSEDDQFFDGKIVSSYSSALFYKRHRAKELGAAVLFVLSYQALLEKWDDYVDFFGSSRMIFDPSVLPKSEGERVPFYYCHTAFAKRALASAETGFDQIQSKAQSGAMVPRFTVKNIRCDVRIERKVTDVKAMNIIGKIEGHDPVLKNEYVAIGAHFDHLGVNASGAIFNGADDDGSGTAAVLETVRSVFASQQNKRSVLVVFHGAEEKGLIGSKYLTDPATVNAWAWKDVTAQINMDMVGRESVDSIYVIGSGRLSSQLKSTNESINRGTGYFHFDYTFDRDDDPNQYYYRSDHYNYAKLGIPIVFFFDGMTSDYHKPSDDVAKINFKKLYKITDHTRRLLMNLTNRSERLVVDKR